MSRARVRLADQMVADIHEYLVRTLPPEISGRSEVWETMEDADRAMMRAISAWEEGEISYAELEAAGARFVEAWENVSSEELAA